MEIEAIYQSPKIIIDKGFERSEVAGVCDILESGGEVSKPSHLQIKYTANQDFGTNPTKSLSQESLKNQGIKPKTKATKQKSNSNNFERGI